MSEQESESVGSENSDVENEKGERLKGKAR